jgi:hypothetical protein
MNPKQRPAEWTAVAAAVALLAGRAVGIDDADTITAIAIVIGFVPTVVTAIVEAVREPSQAKP